MFRDFRQKKRNKFRKITDIAISKVKKVLLDGFSEEQILYVREMHKKLLFISMKHNASQEVGILIDITTWEDWACL